jgi:Tfp pilus assembly protein PilV
MPLYWHPPKEQTGTTLIETVIALSVLAAAALASLMGVRTLYDTLVLSERRTVAESLAKSQLEDIKRQPYIADGCPSPQYQQISPVQIPQDYGVSPSATCIDSQGNEVSTDTGLQRVTVTVTHNNRVVLTLSTYKAKQ